MSKFLQCALSAWLGRILVGAMVIHESPRVMTMVRRPVPWALAQVAVPRRSYSCGHAHGGQVPWSSRQLQRLPHPFERPTAVVSMVGRWSSGLVPRIDSSTSRFSWTTTAWTAARGGATSSPSSSLTSSSPYCYHDREQHQKNVTSVVTVSFLTDVEGDDGYLRRFVTRSRVLRFRPTPTITMPIQGGQCNNSDLTNTTNQGPPSDESTWSLPFPFPYSHCLDFQRAVSSKPRALSHRRQVTDSEIRDGFCRTASENHHMSWGDSFPPRRQQIRSYEVDPIPNDMLVVGGDVWDQSSGDLYVIRQLLYLKWRYPDRVHFILGNRDVNKMRLVVELGGMAENCTKATQESHPHLPHHGGVFWQIGTGTNADPKIRIKKPLEFAHETATERLRWLLRDTMGSPRAFENRRLELLKEQPIGPKLVVTDDEVVESYRRSCHHVTGEMAQYLSQAQFVVKIGDALFMHGALPSTLPVRKSLVQRRRAKHQHINHHTSIWDDLTFAMPWLDRTVRASDINVTSLPDWIHALNDFAHQCVQDWRLSLPASTDVNHTSTMTTEGMWATTGGYHTSFPKYTQLLELARKMTSWTSNGMPRRFFESANTDKYEQELNGEFVCLTREFVRQANVSVICAGHQPQGDAPCPIRLDFRSENRTAWIINADTSYSGDTMWYNDRRISFGRGTSLSARGDHAVSEVLLDINSDTGEIESVYWHGRLSDGTTYETRKLEMYPSRELSSVVRSDDRLIPPLVVGTLVPERLSAIYGVPTQNQTPHGNPWWVKAELEGNSTAFLISNGFGFDQWNRIVNPTCQQRLSAGQE